MKETCETENKPKNFKELIRSSYFWKPASGAIIGGIIGFLYYYFVGCASGSCGITSNPFSSVLFGAAMGFFIVNSPCKTC
jgi:urea transporter